MDAIVSSLVGVGDKNYRDMVTWWQVIFGWCIILGAKGVPIKKRWRLKKMWSNGILIELTSCVITVSKYFIKLESKKYQKVTLIQKGHIPGERNGVLFPDIAFWSIPVADIDLVPINSHKVAK